MKDVLETCPSTITVKIEVIKYGSQPPTSKLTTSLRALTDAESSDHPNIIDDDRVPTMEVLKGSTVCAGLDVVNWTDLDSQDRADSFLSPRTRKESALGVIEVEELDVNYE